MIYTVSNGSGGSPNVLIKTETGATVTLSKGDVVLTKVAEDGQALFENVEYGTWTAQASLNGQTSDSVQIVVAQEIESELSFGVPASELQVGDKVKIGGTKYVVKAKNHSGYPSGAITLISEFIIQNSVFGTSANYSQYSNSTIKSLCQQYYEQLSQPEKDTIIATTRKVKSFNGYPEFTEYIFILNSTEVGGTTDAQMGSNIGFTGNADRICHTEGGAAQDWWLADNSSASLIHYVASAGSSGRVSPTSTKGVRPALNLSSTAQLNNKDSEGYYTIKGADTVSELKDKSLKILGVEL